MNYRVTYWREYEAGHCKLNSLLVENCAGRPCSSGLETSDIVPHVHRRFPQFAMMLECNLMAGNVEVVGDWVVDGDDALELTF